MTALKVITHECFVRHESPPGHPERPDRIKTVWATLDEDFGHLTRLEAPLADKSHIGLVHGAKYYDFVASHEGKASGDFASLDPDTHMSLGSLEAGLRAVGASTLAVDEVMRGDAERVFVAARPPGHHAEPSRAMGFCLFSSAAIAAEHARHEHGLTKVAVLDFDVHHGNGTQAAFWDDGDLLFASSHQMPLYPGTGAVSETGCGNIHNAPLRAGSSGADVVEVWRDHLLPKIKSEKPELIIISAGFDAHRRDPLASVDCEAEDFGTITTLIRNLAEDCAEGRVISLLEGGYDLQGLRDSLEAHLKALS